MYSVACFMCETERTSVEGLSLEIIVVLVESAVVVVDQAAASSA